MPRNQIRNKGARCAEALVVVHAEGAYIDPEFSDGRDIMQNKRICARIAQEVRRCRRLGYKVYYLEDEHGASDSDVVHPSLGKCFSYMNRIPVTHPDAQFLRTKELMVRDGIGRAYVAGFRRNMCVSYLRDLLLGKDNPALPKSFYDNERKHLHWSKDKFESIYAHGIDAHVRHDLTR